MQSPADALGDLHTRPVPLPAAQGPASPEHSLGQPCTGSQGTGEEQQGLAKGSSHQPYELPHARHGCHPPLLLESTQAWRRRGSHLSVGHLVQILVGHVHHEGVNTWGRAEKREISWVRLPALATFPTSCPVGHLPHRHPTAQPALALPGQGTAGQGQPGSSRQRTFVLDHGVQLLPDAGAPARDVHMQAVVAAGLAIRPLPPALQRLGQAAFGLWHDVIHCRAQHSTAWARASHRPFHHGLEAPPPQAGPFNSVRAAPKSILSPSQHALALQVHLLAGKCTEPLLNGLWHRTRGFYMLLLRKWL